MPSKKFVFPCRFCGQKIETYSLDERRHKCSACRTEYDRVMKKTYQKFVRGTIKFEDILGIAEAEMFEFGRQRIANGEVKDEFGTDTLLPSPVRCRFCGKNTVHPSGFCRECRREGLDNVYQVTGRTNGWDRNAGGRVAVKDEWRGMTVMGGSSPAVIVRD